MQRNRSQQNDVLILTNPDQLSKVNISISEYCSKFIVDQLVEASWKLIQLNTFFIAYLPTYSNIKLMNNLEQVNNMLFSSIPWSNNINRQDLQPTPLYVDSLLPISADIDAENLYKKSNSSKQIIIEEDNLMRSKVRDPNSSSQKRQKYSKLQMTEISEQDGFTKQLRKNQQDRKNKFQIEKQALQKKEQLRKEKLKEKQKKKGQKQERFSYDYNGEVFEIRMESKANLVSKVINGLSKDNGKIVKQAINDPNPAYVDPTNRKDKKMALLMFSKRKQEVQFSEVKSLAENIQTKIGVKYTYEGKTYEQKPPKAVPALQLRKTLSQRKITKQDYKKIRDLNGNKNDYEQNLKKSRLKEKQESKPHRTHSEAKGIESRMSLRKKQKIHIANNQLKGKLLQKIPQVMQEQLNIESREANTPTANIGQIDSFNIEYLKSGGTLHASTSKDFYSNRSNNELPKIAHTTLYSKVLPKGRERIKDANEIIRDLRKKFEDKLRV